MRCFGTAPPSTMLATRFCILSTPVSSKAKEERKGSWGFIKSMMRKKEHTEKNERPVGVEVWVRKERWKESVYEGASKSDVGVVTVVCCAQLCQGWKIYKGKRELTHIGGDEHPLRKSIVLQILFKQCKVLDIRSAWWNIGYRVINNQRTAW